MLATTIVATISLPGLSSGRSLSFDYTLVGLSLVVSVLGSLAGLQCARCARARAGGLSFGWLVAVAGAIGAGAVWSMDFIDLLAYRRAAPISVNGRWTVLSLVVAIAAVGAGLYIINSGKASAGRYVGAGTITGVGIAAMHYVGRHAIRVSSDVNFRLWIVALSVLTAVVVACAMLFFVCSVRTVWAAAAASVAIAIGMCAMVYSGLAAVVVSPQLDLTGSSGASVDPLSVALPVFGFASVLLFVLLFVALFDDTERSELLAAR